MDEKKIYLGFSAVVGVMLVGAVFLRAVPGQDDIKAVVADEIASFNTGLASLDERIAGIESDLGGVAERAALGVTAEDMGALQTRLEELVAGAVSQDDLEGIRAEIAGVAAEAADMAAAAVPSADLDALRARIEEIAAMSGTLGDELAALRDAPSGNAPATEVALVTEAPDAGRDPATETADAADDPNAEPGLMPGETAIFGDGALRIFVSRLDPDAGAVRVSIGGETQTLAVGEARMMAAGDSYCRVSVAGVSRIGARVEAVCGDDLAAPEGIRVGETAILGDGNVRVFASMIDDDAARLSVNGDLVRLGVGHAVPVAFDTMRCRVRLDGIDRGHVSVGMECGEAITVSDPVAPGSTAILGEGAARVFLSSATRGNATFAVNGQTLTSGGQGQSVDVDGGCAVTVEEISDGRASFGYVCLQ